MWSRRNLQVSCTLIAFAQNAFLIFIIFYFRRPNKAGLELAKQNIERFYVAVGIIEEFPKFLEILENVLPQFFGNVTQAKST